VEAQVPEKRKVADPTWTECVEGVERIPTGEREDGMAFTGARRSTSDQFGGREEGKRNQ